MAVFSQSLHTRKVFSRKEFIFQNWSTRFNLLPNSLSGSDHDLMSTRSYAEDENLCVSGTDPDTGQICSSPQTHSSVRGIPCMQWHTFPWNTTAVNPQPQHPSALTGMAFYALSALYQVLSSATNTWSFCDCDTMTAPASRSNCPNLLASQLLMLKNLCSDLKRLDITLDGSHDVVRVSLWSTTPLLYVNCFFLRLGTQPVDCLYNSWNTTRSEIQNIFKFNMFVLMNI